jgi:hypothetical protein
MLKIFAGVVLVALLAVAQTTGPIMSFTATTDNVSGAPDSIRIDVLRWSTDAERNQLLTAWTNPGTPANAGRGGRGRGAAAPEDPFAAGNDAAVGGDAAAAGRGAAAGRAGRGGGRGAAAAPAEPLTPERSLTAALDTAPTVGHLWSSEVAGYSLRYAVRLTGQDGGERILFITDRRLGAWNDLWKPAGAAAATNYEFSVIELRLNAKGEGEGRSSLTGKLAVDNATKAIALENYGALPVVLKNVRRK